MPADVPPEVVPFVKRLMAKWPWNRFDYAADARREWQRFRPAGSYPSLMPPPIASVPSQSSGNLVSDVNTMPEETASDVGVTAVATPGLLGVRPSPMVARQSERKELLQLARDVLTDEKHPHQIVLLTGPAGVGKSRVAEWLCQEVHEQGLMLPLRARYRKIAAPLDGVVGALVQHYRVEKVKRTTIEKVLMNLWGVDASDDEGLTWVAGASAWLCRQKQDEDTLGPTKKRFRLDRPELRWLVIRKTLEMTSRNRPILLWLDDLHHAPADTFQRLARLKRDLKHVRLYLVATMRDEDVANDPTARARIELLVEEYNGKTMALETLDASETEQLLRETLPLTDGALSVASTRAKGNPLFALQLLHSWAMRGDLRQQQDGPLTQ